MIVSASEFQKNFGHFKEIAQREPVTVTSNGRESVVLVSAIEFEALAKLREVFARSNGVDDEFRNWADKFCTDHKDVLAELAQREPVTRGVDEDFKKLVAERAEVHKDVLDELSRR